MNVDEFTFRLGLRRVRREWRGRCPCCGYAGAFVLSVGHNGHLVGQCASYQDRRGIAAVLHSAEGYPPRLAATVVAPTEKKIAATVCRIERVDALWNSSQPMPATPAAETGRAIPRILPRPWPLSATTVSCRRFGELSATSGQLKTMTRRAPLPIIVVCRLWHDSRWQRGEMVSADSNDEILTAREAAARLKLSERTLMRLESEGRGPRRVRLSERRTGYFATDLHRWLAEKAAKNVA